MTKKIFYPSLLLFMICAMSWGCKNPCLTFAEDFQLQVQDSTNADLLNPATAHAIDTAQLKIAVTENSEKIYLKRFFIQTNGITTIQVPDMVWHSINQNTDFWIETPIDAGVDTDTVRMRVDEVAEGKCMTYKYGDVVINGKTATKVNGIFILKK